MSNSVFAPRHVYFPANEHKTTVIFLHDRGSTGPELASHLAQSLTPSEETMFQHFPNTRWVFPSARAKYFYWTEVDRRQLTENDKDDTTEWFQLDSSSLTEADIYHMVSPQQLATLQESASYILRIIDDEITRVDGDTQKIFLAGIGQGMALGLVVLLCIHHKLGGFVGLNGWMPFGDALSLLLEQNRIDEAGGFFKSKFIAAAQQVYLQQKEQQQQQQLQQAKRSDMASSPHLALSNPQPVAQSVAIAPNVVVPAHVKQIPVFLSHSQSVNEPVKPELGAQASRLMKQTGFSQIFWRADQEEEMEVNNDISGILPAQLRDMIGGFEDLNLAN